MSLNTKLIKACLSSIRDALIVINDLGTIEYWNPKAEQMFGYSAAEVYGKKLQQLIVPEAFRQKFNAAHAELIASSPGQASYKTVDVEALRRDGTLLPVELSLSTFQDRGRWHSVFILRDISERAATHLLLLKKERWRHTVEAISGQTLNNQTLQQLLTTALIQICTTADAPFREQGAIFVLDRAKLLTLEAACHLSPTQQQQAMDYAHRHGPCAQSLSKSAVATPAMSIEGAGCAMFGAEDRHYSFPLIDPKQRQLGVLSLAIDGEPTTEQINALQLLVNSVATLLDRYRLYRQNQRLRQIVEQNPVAIAITDLHGTFEYVNQQFCQVTGYSRDEVIGNSPRLISSGETPVAVYQDLWSTISSGQPWRGEIRNRKKNGELFWESQIIWPVQGDNSVVSYVALKEDITERKSQQAQLELLATHDTLTDLPNEQLLRDRIDQTIAKTERDASRYLLCAIDVKQMGLVNESLGLSIGDALLKEIATRLKTLFRKADTIARLSGDTFVLICSTEDRAAIATKVKALCAEPFVTAASDIPVEVYTSILELAHPCSITETILQRLTATLHRAKASGSSTPVHYDSHFDSAALAVFSLKNDLGLALSNNQFRLWYQPKVNILTGRVIGAEALIRWQHPERGMVSPLEFIGLAERSGQIIEIGRWVIKEVIRQISVWSADGLFDQPVSLNISARQLSDPQLLNTIKDSLREYQVDPERIELELTESVLAEDPLAVRKILNQFASLGLKIALDDFGTGYSSLAYISKLPINTVKIDQSFVQGIDTNPQSAVIVKSTLSMCRDLGINTIAEGVETDAQGRFMSRHGCQQIQGYLFSKPLPADDFIILAQQGFAALDTSDRNQEVVVILDDDQSILNAIRRSLHHTHYKLLLTTSPNQALEWLATYEVGVVITDQWMATISGVEFLRKIKLAYPNITRMILSGYSDLETITQAINEGSVFRFLSKPWEPKDLQTNIEDGFYFYNLRSSLLKKEALLDRISRNSRLNSNDYPLGMTLIDDQHVELINIHNRLSDAYFSNSEPSVIITLYNEFIDVCRQHFEDEEKIMTDILYPAAEAHTQEHEALLATMIKYGERLVKDYDNVNQFQLISFLKEYFGTHIKKQDLPIGHYLADYQKQQQSRRIK